MKRLLKKLLKTTLSSLSLTRSKHNNEYASFEEAMKHADGYEDNILTKVIVAKGKKFAENLSNTKSIDLLSLRTFIGLASTLNSKKLVVLDFGGAAGTHYFIAKSILSNDIALDWRVVETTQMVKQARIQDLENNELKYFETIDNAVADSEIDLIFASSSIHYTPKPYKVLTSLASINAKILMITRTPFTDVSVVLLQHSALSANGVGEIPSEIGVSDKEISYPVTIMGKHEVEAILKKFGDIRLKISEGKITYSSDKRSFDMWGYVVSKRKEPEHSSFMQ